MTPREARQVLNAPQGADEAAVARAYRAAVKAAHPDHGGDAESLRRVLEAHRLLKAMAKGRLSFPPGPAPGPRADAHRAQAQRPPSRHSVEITVAEALFGGRRRIAVEGRAFELKLPEGLRAGEVLRLARAAAEGGDLYLRIAIASQPDLAVRGDDLWLRAEAPANWGGRLEIDTPRGRRAVWLSRKVGSKRLLRLSGEGLPARGERKAGDLIVRLEPVAAPAETPAREKLRRFAGTWAAA